MKKSSSTTQAAIKVPILAYHKIDTVRELSITCISPKTFERQMRFLAKSGYQSISPELIVAAVNGEGRFPQKPILITFDDGYENFYHCAYPIMKKYGYTATVFLLAGYIGLMNDWDVKLGWRRFKHLTPTQIRFLAKEGFCFGSHGVNHLFLTYQDDATVKYEIQTSKAILENLFQKPIYFFSYPYGNYDCRTARLARECGYTAAFSLNPGNIISTDNLYFLPRMAIYRYDTMWSFKSKLGMMGNFPLHFERKKNLVINRCAYANLLRR
ncbi:TPA: polysaccharide deacetylase family protein [Candidatus Poribacteria bacterium]|nr:polysaccharide deacetylase family protein [Candidatus Poribacteria bacterium]